MTHVIRFFTNGRQPAMSQPGDKSQVSYPSTWGLLDANFNPNWGDTVDG